MIFFCITLFCEILFYPCPYLFRQISASVLKNIQTAPHLFSRTEISDRLFHSGIRCAAMAEKRKNNFSRQIISAKPCCQRRGNRPTPCLLYTSTAVVGAESVYHRFQLGGHSIIIKGRCENNHIRLKNRLSDDLIFILLDTGALIPAGHAPGTGTNL